MHAGKCRWYQAIHCCKVQGLGQHLVMRKAGKPFGRLTVCHAVTRLGPGRLRRLLPGLLRFLVPDFPVGAPILAHSRGSEYRQTSQ